MTQRFPPSFLRSLRNDISISHVIIYILNIPYKYSENQLRFICPLCQDTHTATNPATNLARCFRCKKNFNPIDMTMLVRRCTFTQSVAFLTPYLNIPIKKS